MMSAAGCKHDGELYCLCRKKYEEGQFMIECGKCNGWFHGSCVGIEEYQAQDVDVYHCPDCQIKHGPLLCGSRNMLCCYMTVAGCSRCPCPKY